MAFDFGLKRIGVSFGEKNFCIAHPLTVINYNQRFLKIDLLFSEWHPDLFVVGFPIKYDNSEHLLEKPINKFCSELKKRYKIDVTKINENFTSYEANNSLKSMGVNWKNSKNKIDTYSAMLILEDYFKKHGDK